MHIYIYIYIRPSCRLHVGKHFQNFPSFIVKECPEKWTQKRAKNAFFVVIKSSSFPPKRVKHVASTRKSRQQTGLKARYIYIHHTCCTVNIWSKIWGFVSQYLVQVLRQYLVQDFIGHFPNLIVFWGYI